MTRRAVIYVRVPAAEGADGAEAAVQESRCRRWCAGAGCQVVSVVTEVGTGRGVERAAFAALHGLIRERAVDVVVATRLDRIVRGLCDTGDFVLETRQAGVSLVLLEGPSHEELVASIASVEERYYAKARRAARTCAVATQAADAAAALGSVTGLNSTVPPYSLR